MNRLASETSPYLRQHRANPVDWFPWGDEAFEEARAKDRPVMLSIGYSSCHWCHVMAHESFEDQSTADLLNANFVSVKVDREERPDVDAVYMEAVQTLTGTGGWPMTVFLTPDREPFFGGTYFPSQDRHGLPGFTTVLKAVDEAWRNRRSELVNQADKLLEAIRSHMVIEVAAVDDWGGELGADLAGLEETALRSLGAAFDPEWGGFGSAPKFPQPSLLELLARSVARAPSSGREGGEWLELLTTTLDAMASGGIYDHLGGGFCRYSVDRSWSVPHFEKMLYDQASLARAYLHGWQLTGRRSWLQVVEEIIAYVQRDLASPEGGIFSSEDADSAGIEGAFYVWSQRELEAAVGPDLAGAAESWYGVSAEGNFEGANILHRPVRGDLLRPPEIEKARRLLFEGRVRRPRPGLDDKVLTEWNAMFCSALAEAAAATGDAGWASHAVRVGEFLLECLRRSADGRWLRSYQGGTARHLAYASDYAHLVDAFTRLGELSGERRWTEEARRAADSMLDLFWDADAGGLYTTGDDAEALVVRPKDILDGSTPSANSVAAVSLARLWALTGAERYHRAATAVLTTLGGAMARQPTAFAHALAVIPILSGGATEIVVTSDEPRSPGEMVRVAQSAFLPEAVLAWGEPYESPLWEAKEPGLGYVCKNRVCRQPVSDVTAFARQLGLAPSQV